MSITTFQSFKPEKLIFSKPYEVKVPNSKTTYMKVFISYENNDKLYLMNTGKVFIKSFSETSHISNIHLETDNQMVITKICEAIASHVDTLGSLGSIKNPIYEADEYSSLSAKIETDYETKQVITIFKDCNGKDLSFINTPKSFKGVSIIQLDSIFIGKNNKIQFSLSETKMCESVKKERPRFL